MFTIFRFWNTQYFFYPHPHKKYILCTIGGDKQLEHCDEINYVIVAGGTRVLQARRLANKAAPLTPLPGLGPAANPTQL